MKITKKLLGSMSLWEVKDLYSHLPQNAQIKDRIAIVGRLAAEEIEPDDAEDVARIFGLEISNIMSTAMSEDRRFAILELVLDCCKSMGAFGIAEKYAVGILNLVPATPTGYSAVTSAHGVLGLVADQQSRCHESASHFKLALDCVKAGNLDLPAKTIKSMLFSLGRAYINAGSAEAMIEALTSYPSALKMPSATAQEVWVFRMGVEAQKVSFSFEAGMLEAAETAYWKFREVYLGNPQHLRVLITDEGYLEAFIAIAKYLFWNARYGEALALLIDLGHKVVNVVRMTPRTVIDFRIILGLSHLLVYAFEDYEDLEAVSVEINPEMALLGAIRFLREAHDKKIKTGEINDAQYSEICFYLGIVDLYRNGLRVPAPGPINQSLLLDEMRLGHTPLLLPHYKVLSTFYYLNETPDLVEKAIFHFGSDNVADQDFHKELEKLPFNGRNEFELRNDLADQLFADKVMADADDLDSDEEFEEDDEFEEEFEDELDDDFEGDDSACGSCPIREGCPGASDMPDGNGLDRIDEKLAVGLANAIYDGFVEKFISESDSEVSEALRLMSLHPTVALLVGGHFLVRRGELKRARQFAEMAEGIMHDDPSPEGQNELSFRLVEIYLETKAIERARSILEQINLEGEQDTGYPIFLAGLKARLDVELARRN